ncbi:hypothetical protein [Conexibacter sp. CPCC 206217]|uniref:hypothetical protein n=1 Tax=Conexibacter sp. CPCC 206217 TaxID=3064574 RepID=UPI00271DD36E|nr:hypothetical protein [Conexibacter sp. CPCC 206217]MDO8208951.1 hypothetical protein [Conexibacter sp. CPCC 206217]
MARSGIPLSEWNGSAETQRLRESIETFNEQSARQSAEMITPTRWICALTILMLVGLVVQILLAVVG